MCVCVSRGAGRVRIIEVHEHKDGEHMMVLEGMDDWEGGGRG